MFDLEVRGGLLFTVGFFDFGTQKGPAVPAADQSCPAGFPTTGACFHVFGDGIVGGQNMRLGKRGGSFIKNMTASVTFAGIVQQVGSAMRTGNNLHLHGNQPTLFIRTIRRDLRQSIPRRSHSGIFWSIIHRSLAGVPCVKKCRRFSSRIESGECQPSRNRKNGKTPCYSRFTQKCTVLRG